MENPANDLHPNPESLIALLELRDRYGIESARQVGARTEAERHLLAHGHALAFGCCRDTTTSR